jgi:hypothetical protein
MVIYNNEKVLEAHFEGGLASGKGRELNSDSGYYLGDFWGGKKTGSGIYSFSKYKRYEGEFLDGVPHGKVKELLDNQEYDGGFVVGVRQGEGKLIVDKEFVFEGTFVNGKLNGKGKMHSLKDSRSYVGDYKNDQEHGQGVFITAKGEKYEGEFKEGVRNGHGILTK